MSAEDISSFLKTAEVLKVNGLSPDHANPQHHSTTTPISASSVYSSGSAVTKTSSQRPINSCKLNNVQVTQNTTDKHPNEESQSNVQTMLNPTDFMDLDMTCVKEVGTRSFCYYFLTILNLAKLHRIGIWLSVLLFV